MDTALGGPFPARGLSSPGRIGVPRRGGGGGGKAEAGAGNPFPWAPAAGLTLRYPVVCAGAWRRGAKPGPDARLGATGLASASSPALQKRGFWPRVPRGPATPAALRGTDVGGQSPPGTSAAAGAPLSAASGRSGGELTCVRPRPACGGRPGRVPRAHRTPVLALGPGFAFKGKGNFLRPVPRAVALPDTSCPSDAQDDGAWPQPWHQRQLRAGVGRGQDPAPSPHLPPLQPPIPPGFTPRPSGVTGLV